MDNLLDLKRLLKKQLGNFFSILRSNKWCGIVAFLKLFFEVFYPLVLMLKFWSYVIWSEYLFQELKCWEIDKLNRFCIRERERLTTLHKKLCEYVYVFYLCVCAMYALCCRRTGFQFEFGDYRGLRRWKLRFCLKGIWMFIL